MKRILFSHFYDGDEFHASVHNAERVHLLLCAAHQPFRDPRIAWQVDAAKAGDAFICMGLHDDPEMAPIHVTRPRENALELTGARRAPTPAIDSDDSPIAADFMSVAVLKRFDMLNRETPQRLVAELGVPASRVTQFKAHCEHFSRSAKRLVQMASASRGFASIIAADIDSLLPAFALGRLTNTQFIFDAHEFWPRSLELSEPEIEFWCAFERNLAAFAAARFVASAPTAALMAREYAISFEALPNCEPVSSALASRPQPPEPAARPMTFLFQGGIGATRGLHHLAHAWRRLRSPSRLVIRGPVMDEQYMAEFRAIAGDLLGERITIAPLVTEAELVASAYEADVGLIPYEPVNANNAGACPNKLSQYMAASLAVVTNRLPFVSSVVADADCGITVDFTDIDALAAAIDELAADPARVARYGANARTHFVETFNWNVQSANFYAALDRVSRSAAGDVVRIKIPRIQETPIHEFDHLVALHGLRSIFPLLPLGDVAAASADLVDLRNRKHLSFHRREDGALIANERLPIATDAGFVLVSFLGAHPFRSIEIATLRNGNVTYSSRSSDIQRAVLLKLSGNLIDTIELKLEPVVGEDLVSGAPGSWLHRGEPLLVTWDVVAIGRCSYPEHFANPRLDALKALLDAGTVHEIFPIEPTTSVLAVSSDAETVDLRRFAALDLTTDDDGNSSAVLAMPRAVDVTHVRFSVRNAGADSLVSVTGSWRGQTTSQPPPAPIGDGEVIMTLAGNLTDQIRISLACAPAPGSPPQIERFRAFGVGHIEAPCRAETDEPD